MVTFGKFKFGFIGQGFHPWTPPKGLLKKSLWNLQNFQKGLFINAFLKVLEGGLGGTSFKKFLPAVLPQTAIFPIMQSDSVSRKEGDSTYEHDNRAAPSAPQHPLLW